MYIRYKEYALLVLYQAVWALHPTSQFSAAKPPYGYPAGCEATLRIRYRTYMPKIYPRWPCKQFFEMRSGNIGTLYFDNNLMLKRHFNQIVSK